MKKLIVSSILSCIALPAFAGTANIPAWYTDSIGRSCFTVSNTSAVPADVTVHLYNYNGEEYTANISDLHYMAALGEAYTLPALATSHFCTIPNSESALEGFGTIEAHTASGYQGQVKIVANGYYFRPNDGLFNVSIPINGGNPF
ncbi:hypothetical protein [Vibrio mangrovi]|uniref:Uncharacterized protein n=1 Tax=Vibrio mangrovi TaxID=474394 RepID=A0A1Y6IVS7_9VIBR|nr:hypothetical protein [Vibrio mangrovi]MDW6004630.1 hypothetical protein [Vibrio mangrovi]SMS00920.1 hypothetical protein VIM7927_02193 [Vibrio mangrovi]